MNARYGIKLMDFVNGINVSSSSKIDVLCQSSADDLIGSRRHDLFETSIDDVELSSTLEELGLVKS